MTVKVTEKNGGVSEKNSMTLDEAMLLTGFGAYNIVHMLLNGVILMGVIVQSLALGYVLPAAKCDLNLTREQQGFLSAIPFLAIILMSYFWGWLADTRGRRPVMLYSMLISVVFSVLTSFAPDVASFATLQFLSAIFMSGSTAVVYTYIGEFNSIRHRDKMVAFGSSFVGIGTVVLPAVSWLIIPQDFAFPIEFLDILYKPWRLLVVACAMPFLFGSLFLFFSPESPKFHNAMGRPEAALEVVKKIYAINYWKSADSFPVKCLISESQAVKQTEEKASTGMAAVLSSMRDQTVPLFKSPLLPWTCLTCFVQFGIFANVNGFYVWLPTILNSLANHKGGETRICDVLEAGHSNSTHDAICDDSINTSTFQLSIYIGLVFCSMYIVVGFLVDIIGKKIILMTILIVTGACAVGAHLTYNQTVSVILFAVFQMSGACIGLMTAVTVELFPTKFRAMALCLSMMAGRVGSMVGSNLIGFLLKSNCGLSFYLFGGVIILNGFFCFTIPGKKNIKVKKTVEPTQFQTHEPA